MQGSAMSQRSRSAPCGVYGAQHGNGALALSDVCPMAATQMSSQNQWPATAPCGDYNAAATNFAHPSPFGVHSAVPSGATFERGPVLSTLAASGLSNSRIAASSGGCERQQAHPARSPFCSGAGGAAAGIPVETAPLIELEDCSPLLDHAANAPTVPFGAGAQTLLQNAAEMIQSLSGAVKALSAVPKCAHPAVRLAVPTYSGYGDLLSARDYCDSLVRYQMANRLEDQEVLERVVPVALTDTAARWYRLSGYRATTLEEFRVAFLREFLPADYQSRLRRELELRTQAPDESLQEYVRAMQDLFLIAEPKASNEERVERVIRQAHPTFSAYLRGGRFRDLEELAAEAKRIQGDILAARAYRPPPPASEALEPRCAWGGPVPLPQRQQPGQAAFAATSGCDWELSARALDPYTYGRRAACAAPLPEMHAQGRTSTQRIAEADARDNRPFGQAASRPRQGAEAAPPRERYRGGVRCFRCQQRGHIARDCTAPRPPARSGNGSAGRS
ncbi:uncharacterized protein LOC142576232 [Dermacentor variabilis]|uniref:uncharacterized protein LOC142576232 n=1 Tax=Dermacentor variabilis TaxID=34621 RepID=UPI003F5C7EBD